MINIVTEPQIISQMQISLSGLYGTMAHIQPQDLQIATAETKAGTECVPEQIGKQPDNSG